MVNNWFPFSYWIILSLQKITNSWTMFWIHSTLYVVSALWYGCIHSQMLHQDNEMQYWQLFFSNILTIPSPPSDSKTYYWFASEMAHTAIISFSQLPHTFVTIQWCNRVIITNFFLPEFNLSLKKTTSCFLVFLVPSLIFTAWMTHSSLDHCHTTCIVCTSVDGIPTNQLHYLQLVINQHCLNLFLGEP